MRLTVLLLALLAAPAMATPPTLIYTTAESVTCTAGTCTRSADPAAYTEGQNLYAVQSYVVQVCAASGQTLSGAGTVELWWCHGSLCQHQRDSDLLVTVSSERCQTFEPFSVPFVVTGSTDSVVANAQAVTVSGGAALSVYVLIAL